MQRNVKISSWLAHFLSWRIFFTSIGFSLVFATIQSSCYGGLISDLKVPQITNEVTYIAAGSSSLWIADSNNIWEFDRKSGQFLPTAWRGGDVSCCSEYGGNLYVGAESGLFRCSLDTSLKELASLTNQGGCTICLGGPDRLFAMTGLGLDEYTPSNNFKLLARMPLGGTRRYPGQAFTLLETQSGLWIGTSKGLYRYVGTSGARHLETIAEDINEVFDLKVAYGYLWIGTRDGLYRCENYDADQPLIEQMTLDWPVFSIVPDAYRLWLGTSVGLFKLDMSDITSPDLILENIGEMEGLKSLFLWDGYIWMGTEHGLFRLKSPEKPWNPTIEITVPKRAYVDEPIPVSWTVSSLDSRTTTNLLKSIVEIAGDSTNAYAKEDVLPAGSTQDELKLKQGDYILQVTVQDLFGEEVNARAKIHVVRHFSDMIVQIIEYGSVIYVVAMFLLFSGIAIGSRWSRKCFVLLNDPRVRLFTLYLGITVEYIPAIRNWIFERYFQNLKHDFGKLSNSHVSVGFARPDGSLIDSTKLLAEMRPDGLARRHIWLQGGPGTGKTEVLHLAVHQFCQQPSLESAWKTFQFIPIVIHLRDFKSRNIFELAGNSLESYGMPFSDSQIRDRFLETGAFALFVDGLNETGFDDEIRELNLLKSQIPLLVTSQTASASSKIPVYKLPPLATPFEKQLLKSILEQQSKDTLTKEDLTKLEEKVPDRLWEEIESALEVRLLARLIKSAQPIPVDRRSLYENFFKYSIPKDYPETIICRFAWDALIGRIRRFPLALPLTEEIIKPLEAARIVIPRGTGDFEFRHDLMRGFLATYSLAKHTASVGVILQRLDDPRVWDLDRTDQELAWPLFTDLVDQQALNEIAQFAADQPRIRIILLEACNRTAQRNSWVLQINMGTVTSKS